MSHHAEIGSATGEQPRVERMTAAGDRALDAGMRDGQDVALSLAARLSSRS